MQADFEEEQNSDAVELACAWVELHQGTRLPLHERFDFHLPENLGSSPLRDDAIHGCAFVSLWCLCSQESKVKLDGPGVVFPRWIQPTAPTYFCVQGDKKTQQLLECQRALARAFEGGPFCMLCAGKPSHCP